MGHTWEDYTDHQYYYEDGTYPAEFSPDHRGYYTPIPHSDGIPHQAVVGATSTGTTHPDYRTVDLHFRDTQRNPDLSFHDPLAKGALAHSGLSSHHGDWVLEAGPGGFDFSVHVLPNTEPLHTSLKIKHIPTYDHTQLLSNYVLVLTPIVSVGDDPDFMRYLTQRTLVQRPNDGASAFGYRVDIPLHSPDPHAEWAVLDGNVDPQYLTPGQKATLEAVAKESLIRSGH